MRLRNFLHKGLQRLYDDDRTRGVPPEAADKLRKMLSFLDDMEEAEELRSLPVWRAHLLTGERRGTWSLHVTANLRLTFSVDSRSSEVRDVNLEDYH